MAKKKEKEKLWFEGKKTYNLILTEDDLKSVLKALEQLSNGHFTEKQNEFDVVKTRIYFQMRQ
ncbi:hypothetical protein KKE60_07615 [Patescibacteria group bacterium]|nr:hypothetical protein [Patescibacteria group bacterium]